MSLFLLLSSFAAHAGVYVGNPGLVFWVDRPQHDLYGGLVTVQKVRMNYCDSTWDEYIVGEAIDPVEGYTLPFEAGTYCGARVYWSTSLVVDGSGALGNFELSYSGSYTDLILDDTISPVALTPYTVVYGTPGTGAPALNASVVQVN